MKIAERNIGYEYDPLVIAEIGINHGGSLDVAKRMVDTAINAGIEVIKHQTHIVEDEMSDEAKNVIPGNSDKSIFGKTIFINLNNKSHLLLMIIPIFLTIITMIISDHLYLDLMTSIILSVVIGICSHMSLMIYFSAKHRLLWTLGIRNLLRNKRNTALMMTGLLYSMSFLQLMYTK